MTIEKPGAMPSMFDRWVDDQGRMTSDAYLFFVQINKVLGLNTDVSNTPAPPDPEYELIEDWPILIPYGANKDYVLIQNSAVERTVFLTVSDCDSGTATATFKVNSTPLGGTANSVSSTEQTQAHASANVVGVGDDLIVTLSSNSSSVEVRLNAHTTRTLTSS